MIRFQIQNVQVGMVKLFSSSDKDAALDFVCETGVSRVVFIDTPATDHLAATVESLQQQGIDVVLRDHHDVDGDPSSDRDQTIRQAANRLRELLGSNARISTRSVDPACSSLIENNEFSGEGVAIIADPDPDGLTAAMKAVGVTYPELDSDAAILDGPRNQQTGLSEIATLLKKGMATLPPFNPKRPAPAEKAKEELFEAFVETVQGNAEAKAKLESKVKAYEEGVRVAEKLAATATEPVPGVVLVDCVGKPRFDLGTMSRLLESRPCCVMTVIRKDVGPIASQHGVQYSIAVKRDKQDEVNIQEYLPKGYTSSPEAGTICNTQFLAHVNEQIWDEQVLPTLRVRFSD